MAIVNDNGNNGMVLPVAPMGYGYGNGGGLFGNGSGDIWGLLLVLLLCGNGMWGGFGGLGMGGMMWPAMMGGFGAGAGIDYLYPWLNNSEHISGGFRDQQLANQITQILTALTSGFGDVQLGIAGVNQNICQTGNAITGAVRDGFSAAEIAANGRQMAQMQQAFAAQTAQAQGFNQLSGQLAQCCCDNRLASADLKSTVLAENCADRAALSDGIRDIIAATNAGFQSIKDQLYSDKMDAKNDEISQLRQEILYARGQASQIAQDGRIIDGVYNRLAQCPVGTTPVYGNQPIFTCPVTVNGSGCGNGCGCGLAA